MSTFTQRVADAAYLANRFGVSFVLATSGGRYDEMAGDTIVAPRLVHTCEAEMLVYGQGAAAGIAGRGPTLIAEAKRLGCDPATIVVSTPEAGPITHVHVGRYGWSAYPVPTTPGSSTMVSGYGDDWLGQLLGCIHPEGTTVIDSRPITDEDRLARFSIRGPMVDPRLAPGTKRTLAGVEALEGDDPEEFFGAGGFDYVDLASAITIAEHFGATVHTLYPSD